MMKNKEQVKSIRFNGSLLKEVEKFCKNTDRSFSDGTRYLLKRGLHEDETLSTLGISNLSEVAQKLPTHEKIKLSMQSESYLMLRGIYLSLKENSESPKEDIKLKISEMGRNYMQERFFSD